VQYVHFHSAPYSEWRSSISKVRRIVQQLATWGGPTKFYAVPIGESQRLIARDAPEKLRVTLYRRLMLRIAREIALQTKCLALTTGDSLGQVASQTIESMTAIQASIAPFLVMRPMLGNAKFEIIERAKMIGTHDLSVLPGGDCCSHMLPKNVATKPTIEEAELGEKKLNIPEMVQRAIAEMQLIDVNQPWNEEEPPSEAVAACPFTFEE
jgi:thiamine biosynthesis protein ThiI